MFTNLQEGDEVIKVSGRILAKKVIMNNLFFKINETPVDRLTLPEAQKLIDKAKERLVLLLYQINPTMRNPLPIVWM